MLEQSAYLRTAVDISHLGARVEDEGVLLEAVADLFCHNFKLVAAQVYLVDPSGLLGELRYHVGAGDRKAILRTPGVPVEGDTELGAVLAAGRAQLVRDVSSLPRSAVPPGAQKGVALPLIVEGRVLGALVLYSGEGDVFPETASDVDLFFALADILALALEAVRARAQARRGAPAVEARKRGGSLGPAAEGETQPGATHTVPITLRGEVIGSMSFSEREERALGPDEIELIDSVAEQVGQAIENLSLLEEAQRIARREQVIGDITARLQRATSVDEVLKTAAQAVRAVLGDVEVTARLTPEAIASLAQRGSLDEANGAEE